MIVTFLESISIARLWFCGDTRLNHRLGAGGCVRNFEPVIDSLRPTQWPSLVRHFARLEEFSVRCADQEGTATDWIPRYDELSPSLRRMKLSFPHDALAFFKTLVDHPFPHLEELTGIDFFAALYRATSESEVDFASLSASIPTSLQTLRFSFCYIPFPPCLWPQHLTKITISISHIGPSPVVFPPGLEELDLCVGANDDDTNDPTSLFSATWPSGLLNLKVYMENDATLTLEDMKRLPRGLTSLDIQVRDPLELSDKLLMALPPNLILLDLHLNEVISTKEMLALLPKSLTFCGNLPEQPSIELLKLFPPNLTYLLEVITSPEFYGALPKGMQHIISSVDPEFSVEASEIWPRLPDSLIRLSGLNSHYLTQHSLPTQLTTLKLESIILEDAQVERLSEASKLTKLVLEACSYSSKRLFAHLPRNLTTLRFRESSPVVIDADDAQNLPQTLEDFISSKIAFGCPNLFSFFPKGLTSISFSIDSLEVGFLGEKECFLPNLTFLSISISSAPAEGLAKHIFATLPRTLKYLEFMSPADTDLDITTDSLNLLPLGLISLNTAAPAKKVKAEDWKKPLSLKSARMGRQVLHKQW